MTGAWRASAALTNLVRVFWRRVDDCYDGDLQKPVRRSLCRSVRKNFHWKCFLLTLFIDGCFVYIFWCRFSYANAYAAASYKNDYESGPCSQGYNFIPVAFGIMLYVVYIMECWHCKTRLDMVAKTDATAVSGQIDRLRAAMPVVWWRAVCYHYVRRTRQVTRYRNGDAVTTTQVYYERINSHTAGSVFLYHDCGVKDISKQLVNLTDYPIVKIRFSKGFVFANLQSANEFEEQRTRFFQENEMRDDYMEVREGLDLTDCTFRDYVICYCKSPPWYTRQIVFWLASLLLCSWPLRVFIETRTAYVHYQVTKLFGTNYLSPTSQNYTGPLTRASTMDSADLEAAVRTGYVIVPSYSQALLMDPVGQTAAGAATGTGTVMRDSRSGLVTVQRGCRPPALNGQGGTTLGSRERLFMHMPARQRTAVDGGELDNEQLIVPNYGALNESNAGTVPLEQLTSYGSDQPGTSGQHQQHAWPHLKTLWSWLVRSQNGLGIGPNNRVNDNAAVMLEQLRAGQHPPRSRSLNWLRGGSSGGSRLASRANSQLRRPAVGSRSYHTLPNTPEDGRDCCEGADEPRSVALPLGADGGRVRATRVTRDGRRWPAVVDGVYATGAGGSALYPEEPPPPYELAVRMCAPLYERIRRSASSLHRFVHWPAGSRSSTKDWPDSTSATAPVGADESTDNECRPARHARVRQPAAADGDDDPAAGAPMLPVVRPPDDRDTVL